MRSSKVSSFLCRLRFVGHKQNQMLFAALVTTFRSYHTTACSKRKNSPQARQSGLCGGAARSGACLFLIHEQFERNPGLFCVLEK